MKKRWSAPVRRYSVRLTSGNAAKVKQANALTRLPAYLAYNDHSPHSVRGYKAGYTQSGGRQLD